MPDVVGGSIKWNLDVNSKQFDVDMSSASKKAQKTAKSVDGSFGKMKGSSKNLISSVFNLKNAFVTLAGATGIGLLTKSVIEASNKMESSILGLTTVAKAFGSDVEDATSAAQNLADDGLLSVSDAASGLKNLLATGFSLPESIKLMESFKDSAAFNRQGTLEFGQAIVGATEGLKNQNSIMVDNAGVTKNLSNILKEAGFSASQLGDVTSDATVRQALYNGILKETSVFQGDAAKAADTTSGKISQLNTSLFNLKVAIGDQIKPLLDPLITGLTGVAMSITGIINGEGGGLQSLNELFSTLAQIYNEQIKPSLDSLWTTIKTQLIPNLQELWTQLSPILIPVLKILGTVLGTVVVIGFKAVIDILTQVIQWISSAIDGFIKLIDFLKTISGSIKSAFSDVYNALTEPFTKAWNKIKDVASNIKDELDKINPFHRESPSLVDNVKAGVQVIEEQYSLIDNLTMQPVANLSTAGLDATDQGGGFKTSQNINVNIGQVNDMQDVDMINREIAFRASLLPG